MPKKKKKSPSQTSRRTIAKDMARAASAEISYANKEGSTPAGYIRQLKIASADAIKEAESGLIDEDKAIFRCLFLSRVSQINEDKEPTNRPGAETMELPEQESTRRFMRGVFNAETSILLADIARARTGHKLYAHEELEDIFKFIDEAITDEFWAPDTRSGLNNTSVADCCASNFLHVLDWDYILDGDRLHDWASNINRLAARFFDDDTRKHYETVKANLINDVAGYYATVIPKYRAAAVTQLLNVDPGAPTRRELMFANAPQAPKEVPAQVPAPQPTILLAAAPKPSLASLPIVEQIKLIESNPSVLRQEIGSSKSNPSFDSREYSKDCPKIFTSSLYAACYCAMCEMGYGECYDEVDAFLTERYSMQEILYTALTLMPQYKKAKEYPLFIHQLLYTIYNSSASSCSHELVYLGKQDAATHIKTINTTAGISVPDDYCDAEGIEKEQHHRKLSIRGHFRKRTGAVIPTRMTLDSRDAELFMQMGMDRDDALMLCGYERACSEYCNSWAVRPCGDCYSEGNDDDENTIDYDELVERERENGRNAAYEQARAELREELMADIKDADTRRERAEIAESQIRREHRTASYRAEKAEKELAAKTAECDELAKALEQALAKQEQLQQTIMALSPEIVDNAPEELDDEDDAEFTFKYPMPEIGKDKKICVFGGTRNWANELLRRFPNITVFDVDTAPNEDTANHSDVLMVFSFAIPHKYYWVIRNSAKRCDIPMVYFESKGVNACSRQIIDTYNELLA